MARPHVALWLAFCCYHVVCGRTRSGTSGLEVLKRQVEVPRDFPPSLPLFHLPSSDFSLGEETKVLTKQTSRVLPAIETDQYFAINNSALVLRQSLFNLTAGEPGLAFELEVNSKRSYLASYRLKIRCVSNITAICTAGPQLCFFGSKLKYSLPDSLPPGQAFDVLYDPIPQVVCRSSPIVKFSVPNGSEFLDVDQDLGSLRFKTLPEPRRVYPKTTVACTLQSGSETTQHSIDTDVKVVDVDNSPPYLLLGRSPYVDIDLDSLKVGAFISDHFNVYDKDTPKVTNYVPQLEGDYLGLFSVRVLKTHRMDDGTTLIISGLTPVQKVIFPNKTYEFQMVFEDEEMEGDSSSNKVVFHIRIHNRTAEALPDMGEEFYAQLSASASQFAQVGNVSFPSQQRNKIQFKVKTSTLATGSVFKVTPKTGIVYVNDAEQLRNMSESVVRLNVSWVKPDGSGYYVIIVNITAGDDYCYGENYETCGVHGLEFSCVSSCGQGSPDGKCQWRDYTAIGDLSSKGYATCSPYLLTCPDGTCDELERLNPTLCPQDCASELHGQVRAREDGGIEIARGICSCSHSDSCICHLPLEPNPPEQRKAHDHQAVLIIASPAGNGTGPAIQEMKASNEACGAKCVLVIVLSSLFVLTVTVISGFVCLRRGHWRWRKKVSRGMPLSTVRSDYVDERRYSATTQVISTSLLQAATLDHVMLDLAGSRKNSVDTKWEFNREHLKLMQVLGEGEFGRVVRARAWNIRDQPGYTTVAVKMLKENCSSSDREDLLSELNLLKEVHHPHVIQLLGACTQKDGPLYVIVEYADLGSLRNYLRQCRRIDFDRIALLGTVENPSYIAEATALKYRDLLSFAWQITKGMSYLSDIKVVHRDLAARNILLAQGKVAKISDFGLSRDIYEGDTYLKKSKGRVPVKWMALESLQDHVYTSKSDVWSFGIVLWEIVTLGASPYPGITPERLYQLLRAGYRMERPDNCSEDLYNMMRQCWRHYPSDRPPFKSLAQKLDSLLQDTAVYLDLDLTGSWIPAETESSCDDEPFTPLTYSAVTEETQLEYGNLCHLPSESSESTEQDV